MTGHVYTIRILLCHAAELQHEPKKQPSTVHGPKQSQGADMTLGGFASSFLVFLLVLILFNLPED